EGSRTALARTCQRLLSGKTQACFNVMVGLQTALGQCGSKAGAQPIFRAAQLGLRSTRATGHRL
ncbi:MAG: hypothetical protein RLZZ494_536, partial [Pseudomonadota bacterium]